VTADFEYPDLATLGRHTEVAFLQIGSDSRVVEEFKDRIKLALPHGMDDAAQTNGSFIRDLCGSIQRQKR